MVEGAEWVQVGALAQYKGQGPIYVIYEVTPDRVEIRDLLGSPETYQVSRAGFHRRYNHIEPPPPTTRFERLLEEEGVI